MLNFKEKCISQPSIFIAVSTGCKQVGKYKLSACPEANEKKNIFLCFGWTDT